MPIRVCVNFTLVSSLVYDDAGLLVPPIHSASIIMIPVPIVPVNPTRRRAHEVSKTGYSSWSPAFLLGDPEMMLL
jgi:hypothetical protein